MNNNQVSSVSLHGEDQCHHNLVETPCKFNIAKLLIRKLGS